MGERPKGMQIDRIDNNGPYSKNNCRWATRSEQNKNRRSNGHAPRAVVWKGVSLTIHEIAAVTGLTYKAISFRLQQGQTLEAAIKNRLHRKGFDFSKPCLYCERKSLLPDYFNLSLDKIMPRRHWILDGEAERLVVVDHLSTEISGHIICRTPPRKWKNGRVPSLQTLIISE
jgi:hypothetical protein